MPSQNIQWFPGHMAKTRRLITENLKNVDAVVEILDARIPYSSRNPEISKICSGKPSLLLLNKSTLADPAVTAYWSERFTTETTKCLETDCISGKGISDISHILKTLCLEKLEKYEQKGMYGRPIKVMVVGIPNVGKSSLINKLCGAKKTKVENRPGVTLDKQWVTTDIGVQLLDMPGVLWPKFDERVVGENLAITGAIKDDVLDVEEVATALCGRLRDMYPECLKQRYKLDCLPSTDDVNNYELLQLIGKKRGHLMSGGMVDTERTSNMLIDEFRSAKIGRISLDAPKR